MGGWQIKTSALTLAGGYDRSGSWWVLGLAGSSQGQVMFLRNSRFSVPLLFLTQGLGFFIFLQLKLEFSSPKSTSDTLLEEEKSVDFVFIPPETKPRILTEHQKEVLRSKRSVCYCFKLNVKCHSLSS